MVEQTLKLNSCMLVKDDTNDQFSEIQRFVVLERQRFQTFENESDQKVRDNHAVCLVHD